MAALVVFALFFALFFLRGEIFFSDINFLFIKMLLKAIVFALSQSVVSVALSFLSGIIIALFLFRCGPRFKFVEAFTRHLSVLAFFAPTIVVSVTYLSLSSRAPLVADFGFFPVVCAHMLLNTLFVAVLLLDAMRASVSDSSNALYAALCYGQSPMRALWLCSQKKLFGVLRSWAPLIFWWAFNSFTTVLILGGGPKFSTPEVLLFYSYNAGDQSSRILLLIFVQLVLGVLLYRLSNRSGGNLLQKEFEVSQLNANTDLAKTFYTFSGVAEKTLQALGLLLFCAVSLFWLWPVLLSVSTIGDLSVETSSVFASAKLLGLSYLFFAIWLGLGLVSRGRFFRLSKLSVLFSPLLLAILIFEFKHVFFFSNSLWLVDVLNALALFVAAVPLASFWISERYEECFSENQEMRSVYSAGKLYLLRYVLYPKLKSSILLVFVMLSLLVLGDVGISSIMRVGHASTLAMSVYKSVSVYDFDSGFRLFSLLLIIVLPFLSLVLLQKSRERT